MEERKKRSVRLVMLHVDDMLFAGERKSCGAFSECISSLSHSPAQFLSVVDGLTFCGVDIAMNPDKSIYSPQQSFYSELNEIHAIDVLKDGQLLFPCGIVGNSKVACGRLHMVVSNSIRHFV